MLVLKAIRESVGPDFPVLIKMNCGDFQDNGLELDDAIQVGQMLEKEGIDTIELIREPGLINRWRRGDLAGSACLSDNKCFGPIMAGKGLYCVMDQKDRQSS